MKVSFWRSYSLALWPAKLSPSTQCLRRSTPSATRSSPIWHRCLLTHSKEVFVEQEATTPTAQSTRCTRTCCMIRRGKQHAFLFSSSSHSPLVLSWPLTWNRSLLFQQCFSNCHLARTMTTWVLFLLWFHFQGFMTFSLTVCLLTVSLGVLARVGQEHRSTVQEKMLLRSESLSTPSCKDIKRNKTALEEPAASQFTWHSPS